MHVEEVYSEDRLVTCDQCEFDGELELALVSFGTVEMGEWECPDCKAFHEYSNDTIWDRADEENDRRKEGW